MPARSHSHLTAKPGDRLVVRAHHQGEAQQDAEILKVLGKDGAGNDTLKGGPGKDKLKGGAGKDKQIQ